MADEGAHWRVREEALKHPDGRAKGGEPCVICGNPVPASASWQSRDRHVCSSRCNINLSRRYNRGSPTIDKDRIRAAVEEIGPRPNPRTSGPRLFATRPDDLTPLEWEGYGPIPGDVVERYGILTTYLVMEMPEGYYTDRVIVAVADAGEMFVAGANPDGFYSSLVIGPHGPDGPRHGRLFDYQFMCQGVLCEWRRELITDLFPDGAFHFRWEAYAAVPVDAPTYPAPLHSSRYRAEMDRRKRVSSNTSRHERRARESATIDRFDPLGVYDRDGWFCQICGSEVDREVLYPDPLSATLDHVVPLSRGGDHTRENTVLAHLRCNLVKSDS